MTPLGSSWTNFKIGRHQQFSCVIQLQTTCPEKKLCRNGQSHVYLINCFMVLKKRHQTVWSDVSTYKSWSNWNMPIAYRDELSVGDEGHTVVACPVRRTSGRGFRHCSERSKKKMHEMRRNPSYKAHIGINRRQGPATTAAISSKHRSVGFQKIVALNGQDGINRIGKLAKSEIPSEKICIKIRFKPRGKYGFHIKPKCTTSIITECITVDATIFDFSVPHLAPSFQKTV